MIKTINEIQRASGLYCLLFILLLLPMTIAALESRNNGAEIEAELLQLDKDLDDAWYNTHDKVFLSRLLADNFIYVHSGAKPVETKQQVLSSLKRMPSRKRHGMDVRLHGDTAVVSGFSTIYGYKGYRALKFHIQRIYVKESHQWQVVAQHVTLDLTGTDDMRWDVINDVYQKYWSKQKM